MKVGIHQPHYFPWLGYLDKMAKSDKFIILDDVQLTDNSNMFRNRFLTKNKTVKYLTIGYRKKNYLEKKYNQIEINDDISWQINHANFIIDNYKKSPYFDEVWDFIKQIFNKNYSHLYEVTIESIMILKQIFEIKTDIILQSTLNYDQNATKNELLINLCVLVDAEVYLSGIGAKNYMKTDIFEKQGIKVEFQSYSTLEYKQFNTSEFIPNLSALDLLFNCGIQRSRELFWKNIKDY
jgi:hypothetical protein